MPEVYYISGEGACWAEESSEQLANFHHQRLLRKSSNASRPVCTVVASLYPPLPAWWFLDIDYQGGYKYSGLKTPRTAVVKTRESHQVE